MKTKTIEKKLKTKAVRVTLELPVSFVRLLDAKAQLSNWFNIARGEGGENQLDAGSILGLLVLMEARGGTEEEIHAMTPMMWRTAGGPTLVHEERKVIFE